LGNLSRTAKQFALASLSIVGDDGLFCATPARAEFEIKESQIEKGEVELEYRGAVHWGFPSAERAEAVEEETGADAEDEEGEFLRQSHDFEVAYGFAERWLVSATLGTDEPLDQNFDLSSIALELQYELIERKGNGLGLGFTGGYGFATRGGEADEIEFGPIVELASGKSLLTLNPFFNAQVGDNRQTDGLGFEYGWRAEYDFAKRWGIGVEMFGEIEDLSNAGSFNDQPHSLGPTLFYNPGEDHHAESDDGPSLRPARDGSVSECRGSVWTDRRYIRHRAQVPGLTCLLVIPTVALTQARRSLRSR
jgi:hypothetical protein